MTDQTFPEPAGERIPWIFTPDEPVYLTYAWDERTQMFQIIVDRVALPHIHPRNFIPAYNAVRQALIRMSGTMTADTIFNEVVPQ